MNVSGTLSFFKLFRNPSLMLPQHTVSTFADLPVPLSKAFPPDEDGKEADIRAVILDKDNCFAAPHTTEVHPSCKEKFEQLKAQYPHSRLLIVSNTAGTSTADPTSTQLQALEAATGVKVLRHSTKKPGCHPEIIEYLRSSPTSTSPSPSSSASFSTSTSSSSLSQETEKSTARLEITKPSQIVVIGDRLLTDVMMANLMGARGIWVKDGVTRPGFMARCEIGVAGFLLKRGYVPPMPRSDFE